MNRLNQYAGPFVFTAVLTGVAVVVYLVHYQQVNSVKEMKKGVERDKERIAAKRLQQNQTPSTTK